MKIKEGFKLRKVGNEFIVSGEGVKLINFNKLIALNSSAAYLWQNIGVAEFNKETLTELLIAEYEISKEEALKDASDIIKAWLDAGLIEE